MVIDLHENPDGVGRVMPAARIGTVVCPACSTNLGRVSDVADAETVYTRHIQLVHHLPPFDLSMLVPRWQCGAWSTGSEPVRCAEAYDTKAAAEACRSHRFEW